MKALVRVCQGYYVTYYKFDDEISTIHFGTILKERAMDRTDRNGDIIKTCVSVILNPDDDDIED